MNILSLIYSIPTTQYIAPDAGAYVQSHSPGSSSPTSESSYQVQAQSSAGVETEEYSTDHDGYSSQVSYPHDSAFKSGSSSPTITSASPTHDLRSRNSVERLNGSISHAGENGQRISMVSSKQGTGAGLTTRSRAPSNLPPRPPCPSASPPQTPPISYSDPPLSPRSLPPGPNVKRTRGESVSHKRTGSGGIRLEVLREEETSLQDQQHHHSDVEPDLRRPSTGNGYLTPKTANFDSPPLPPVPSPSSSEPGTTPRVANGSSDSPTGGSPPIRTRSSRTPGGRVRGSSTLSSKSEGSSVRSQQLLINDSTVMGTISQRRNKANIPHAVQEDSALTINHTTSTHNRLTAPFPINGPSSLNIGRLRAASQPVRPTTLTTQTASTELGLRSGNSIQHTLSSTRKMSSGFRQSPQPPIPQVPNTGGLHAPTLTLIPPPPLLTGELQTTPTSPLPPLPPVDPLRKPYHLMNLLRYTITSKSGGYITRRLHVPREVWTQGGAYLSNLPEKIRVIDILCEALGEVQNASSEFCGPSVSSGFALGVGSVGRKEGEVWAVKLEELSNVCDGVVANFGKKLGVGEGFVARKSTGVCLNCKTLLLHL